MAINVANKNMSNPLLIYINGKANELHDAHHSTCCTATGWL